MVEQFGVRRPLAELAEVAGRADQAPAEVVLPDAVHHHARSERVILAGDRAGQLKPAAALREGRRVLNGEDGQEAMRGLLA